MRSAPILPIIFTAVLVACTPADQAGAEPDSAVNEMTGSLPEEQLLTGTRWELTSLGGTNIATDTTAKTPHILLLEDESRVQGSGSCNSIKGSYELDGHDLRFGALASTRMACQPGMDVETAFLGALEQTRSWAINGDRLRLSDSTGTVVATLQAADDSSRQQPMETSRSDDVPSSGFSRE